MDRARRVLTLTLFSGALIGPVVLADAGSSLDKDDRRWLEQVRPLITPEEIGLFEQIDARDRGRFQEIFWARRDPDPRTPRNELKDEFEARRAAADRQFRQAGLNGAETDMGEVFLLLGPPDVVAHGRIDSGEPPLREAECDVCEHEKESSSVTDVGPTAGLDETRYVTWRYGPDPLVGIPLGLDVVFRSQSTLGYRLVEGAEVKRALERARRLCICDQAVGYDLDERGSPLGSAAVAGRGDALDRALQRTSGPTVKFQAVPSYFASEGDASYVPVLLDVEADSLTWDEGVAEVTLLGCVDEVDVEPSDPFRLRVGLARDVAGHARLELPFTLSPGRHKLRLAVQDDASGRAGARVLDLVVPDFKSDALTMSSVVTYSEVWEGEPSPGRVGRAFRFGGVRVVPRSVFRRDQKIGLLYFVYGLTESAPRPLVVQHAFFLESTLSGQTREMPLEVSGSRAIGSTEIPLRSLVPGAYTLVVAVTDRSTNTTLSRSVRFELRDASS